MKPTQMWILHTASALRAARLISKFLSHLIVAVLWDTSSFMLLVTYPKQPDANSALPIDSAHLTTLIFVFPLHISVMMKKPWHLHWLLFCAPGLSVEKQAPWCQLSYWGEWRGFRESDRCRWPVHPTERGYKYMEGKHSCGCRHTQNTYR